MRYLLAGLMVLGFIAVVPNANAVLTLTHGNSTFTVTETYAAGQWYVDGTYQLFQQGFWWGDATQEYRLGNSFTGQTLLAPNSGRFFYQTPGFYAELTYTLYGGAGGSGMSDVAESIYIRNTSGSSIDLRFFQYSDFDLGGTAWDDTVWFPNTNTVRQGDGVGSVMLSETVVTPAADRWEGKLYSWTQTKLDDAGYYDLDNTPAIGGGSVYGDATWAYQWNRTLAPDATFLASKNKRLEPVPEPATLLLLGLVLGAAGIARWRKKSV
jgi:hypothetical protein